MDGIVNVNKPVGVTSHDVVNRLRRILNMKKIGHTGTLDPDAAGVLPMCVGKATKLAEYLVASDKEYRAVMTLGAVTDTQDASGEVLESFEVNVTEEDIRNAVKSFEGEIGQIPPMYSAVKMDGKKLYELAREGKTIEREERRVTVFSIDITAIDLEKKTVDMTVKCSKGTYIRTLCNDIGASLGCGGYMSSLVRTKTGRFELEKAYTIERIEEMVENGDLSFLVPTGEALSEYEKVTLAERNATRVRYGIAISVQGLTDNGVYRLFDEQGEFLALAKQEKGKTVMLKRFFGEVQQ